MLFYLGIKISMIHHEDCLKPARTVTDKIQLSAMNKVYQVASN